YLPGEQTTTHQYLVTGSGKTSRLLIASLAVDPYAMLLSPYRDEYFARLGLGARNPSSSPAGVAGVKGADDESLLARQQFARGQTAQLGYCGTRDYDKAVGAYERALAVGFRDPVWTAEAHHRLGLALQGSGAYARAKIEMEQALALRPNVPEVLNNLGTVYAKLGDRKRAIAAFEQAVTLRPNYYLARYNLAESYEPLDPTRAVMEYETYLALVEGIPEEEGRAEAARERLKALKR
ncbi:MAG: tetratricopeptide repeat protein, partial [Nitrospirales bacterium]